MVNHIKDNKKFTFWGTLLVGIIITSSVIITFFPRIPPPLILNIVSDSLTKGIYFFHKKAVPPYTYGDVILFQVDEKIKRHLVKFFPSPPTRLLKIIIALGGDTVCRKNDELVISRKNNVVQYNLDIAYLSPNLPSGCSVLSPGQIYVGGESPRSFDSRYFGAVQISNVIGIYKFHR